jgi:hypothetical protein
VIVVVGSRHDQAAREIVAHWELQGAALLTCEDLSTAGWRHRLFDPSESRIVVGGRVVRESDICGVLVRRPWILERELVNIAAVDREYLAAEMNAFLLSWLSHLSCRVLNRPAGTCLCGPNWRPQQWAQAASSAGIQVEPRRWRVPAVRNRKPKFPEIRPEPLVEVTVFGDRCFGNADKACFAGAKRLAEIAGTDLLGIRFSAGERGLHFLSANTMPALADTGLAQAVCEYLSN